VVRYTRKVKSTQARTRTRSADVTDSLLEAALDLLEEGGAHGVTVRAVATRAGVAPMGVYSRFGNKDGLLEALFVQGFDGLHSAITGARGSDARARLRQGCLAYRRFALAHPHLYELMFRQMLELELTAESLERAEQTFSELVSRVADAMSAGLLAEGDDVDVAQQIWNGMHGAVALELAGVTFSSDPERTYARMIDTLFAGLASA
jgi:AcrR family transcriptional regulator